MLLLSIYFVFLAFLSLNPWVHPDSSLAIGNISWDKIDHGTAYFFLSLFLMSAYRFHKQQWVVSFMILLTSSLVGVFFEYCQLWFTSTRTFSYQDAVANIFGALLDEAAIAAEKPRHYKSVKPKTISKKNLKISPKIT